MFVFVKAGLQKKMARQSILDNKGLKKKMFGPSDICVNIVIISSRGLICSGYVTLIFSHQRGTCELQLRPIFFPAFYCHWVIRNIYSMARKKKPTEVTVSPLE